MAVKSGSHNTSTKNTNWGAAQTAPTTVKAGKGVTVKASPTAPGQPTGSAARPKKSANAKDIATNATTTGPSPLAPPSVAPLTTPQAIDPTATGRTVYQQMATSGTNPADQGSYPTVAPTSAGNAANPTVAAAMAGTTPPTNPGYNQAYTTPVSGAMAQYGYSPQGLGTLYDNPQALTSDILNAMGITNPGLANQLSKSFDPAVAAQFILNGGLHSGDNSTLNFANEYLQNMVTPGGRTVDFNALVSHLLGAPSEDTNPLGAYLNANKDPRQQVSAANNLFGQTLGGLNPYAQQAYSNYAQDQGTQYQALMAKSDPTYSSYIDYLNRGSKLGQWAGRG